MEWKSGERPFFENGRPWHFSEVKFHFRMCCPDTLFEICSLSLSLTHTYIPTPPMEILVKTNGFFRVKFREISSNKKDFSVDKKKTQICQILRKETKSKSSKFLS
jgi:hypothetical protein